MSACIGMMNNKSIKSNQYNFDSQTNLDEQRKIFRQKRNNSQVFVPIVKKKDKFLISNSHDETNKNNSEEKIIDDKKIKQIQNIINKNFIINNKDKKAKLRGKSNALIKQKKLNNTDDNCDIIECDDNFECEQYITDSIKNVDLLSDKRANYLPQTNNIKNIKSYEQKHKNIKENENENKNNGILNDSFNNKDLNMELSISKNKIEINDIQRSTIFGNLINNEENGGKTLENENNKNKNEINKEINKEIKEKNKKEENDDTFIGNDGKDSKDVAILLLCELHNELNKNSDSIQKEDKNLDHTNLLKVYKDKNDFEDKNKTIISKTFNFFIKYEHKCTKNCKIYNQKYYTMESDNIIIFELEKIYKDINSRSNNRSYGSYGSYGNYGSYGEEPEISLEECLKHYSKTEIIECPYCKTRTLNIKKTICTLPKIIIFVLRRGLNIKFDCKILYKSELDMKDFYEEIPGLFNGINTKYQLCCATFAYDWTKGTIHTGHTVAFCKTYKGKENKPQYYIFNDSRPIKSDIDEIENKTPYLLFYERCDK